MKKVKISGILEEKIHENPNKSLPVIIFLDSSESRKRMKTRNSAKISVLNALMAKNAKIKHVYKNINAISASIKAGEIENIAKLQDVGRIYYDINYTVLPLEKSVNNNFSIKLSTSTKAIGADYAWSLGYTGKNITVAVIDTGIDYTHPDLGGCFGPGCRVVDGYDFVNNDNDPKDDNLHGTHIAGIIGANGTIKGVAPDVSFYALKVCNSSGSCSSSDIIAGIDWAISKNARIISISLGGSMQPNDEFGDPVNIVADYAVSKGIVVVAAAGNEGPGTGTVSHPGAGKRVITVGSSNDRGTANTGDDTVSSFSNRGPSAFGRLDPEVLAPGENIYSTACCGYGSYTSASGTSMATPHVSGAAAILLEKNPDLKPEEIRRILMQTATPISNAHVFEQGAGIINLRNALSYNITAKINNNDRWEVGIFPGFTAFAEIELRNSGNETLNITFSADNLTDLEGDKLLPASYFTFPSNITLPSNTSRNITISLSIPLNASPAIYGSTIKINAGSQEIRIPVVVTVPLLDGGKISGSVDDDYSEFLGSISEYGDWIYYKLYSHNGSSLKVRLEWQSNADDLDLYLYSENGELLNVSDMVSTNWEEVTLADIATKEHWIAVHAYSLAGKINYNITIAYNSSIQVIPSSWQGEVEVNKTKNITFIIKNNGNPKNNIKLNVFKLGEVKSDFSSASVDSFSWPNLWNLSSSGIAYYNPKYLSAKIEWQNIGNDLDLYLSYYDSGSWQYSNKYKSKHDNAVLGEAVEELRDVDIEYFMKKYGDIGLKVVNWGSTTENLNITVNITDATPWDAIKPNETVINLSSGEARQITLSINAKNLAENESYDAFLNIENGDTILATIPLRLRVLPDLTPPEITFVAPTPENNSFINRSYAFINITANENLSIAILEWNGKNETMLGSGRNWHVNKTSLSDGVYYYSVYANDSYGNWNATIPRKLIIDTTPPRINLSSIKNVEFGSDFTINITIYEQNPAYYNLKRNGSLIANGTYSDGSTIILNESSIFLGTGSYLYEACANDTAANTNCTSLVVFINDTTPPAIKINAPSVVERTSAENMTVNITELNPASYVVYENGTEIKQGNYSNGIAFNISINTSKVGLLNYTIIANDTAGNENSSSVLITIQDTAPPKIIVYSPLNKTYGYENISLNVSADEPISAWWYSLDDGANTTFTPNTTLLNLSEGMHKLVLYANDSYGNLNSSLIYFIVDLTPPSIKINSPENKSYTTTKIPLNFSITENANWSVYIDNNATLNGSSLNYAQTITLAEGLHNLTITAIDAAGNTNSSSVSFKINITSSETGTGSNVTITFSELGINITFETIISNGTTTAINLSKNPVEALPNNLKNASMFFNITTTADYSGKIKICFFKIDVKAYHNIYQYNGSWNNITALVDFANDIICGSTESFSTFVVAYEEQSSGGGSGSSGGGGGGGGSSVPDVLHLNRWWEICFGDCIIVYGKNAAYDDVEVAQEILNELKEKLLQHGSSTVRQRVYRDEIKIYNESEVSDLMLRTNHLILIGGDYANSIVAKVNKSYKFVNYEGKRWKILTPENEEIKSESGAIIEFAGSPYSDYRKVLIIAGNTRKGTKRAKDYLISGLAGSGEKIVIF